MVPRVAICYDFDGTLIRGNMQDYTIIPRLIGDKDQFWESVNQYSKKHDMDYVLAYMYRMMEAAEQRGAKLTRNKLRAHGRKLQFFDGLDDWFDRVSNYYSQQSRALKVEHYIISSGIDEMIKSSKVGRNFKRVRTGSHERVFASGFLYDDKGVPIFPARSVNYTTKTQYLFRINKGILNSWDDKNLNERTPTEYKRIPFSRMIYIGDGLTDVPAMKTVNTQGGYSIVVYPPGDEVARRKAEEVVADSRAQFCAEANYEKGSRLERIITTLLGRIANEADLGMNLDAFRG